MRLGYTVTGKEELIGSYEPEKILRGNAEDYDKQVVVELMTNWNRYNAYARGKHKICREAADDLLSDTLADLASEEFEENSETYKNLEGHIKSRIDYTFAGGMSSTKTSFRPNMRVTPLIIDYEGSDRESSLDLSDKQQVQKGDGLSKSLIDIETEIEDAKPYRYLQQGVDMFKVMYVLVCTEEYSMGTNADFSDTLYILQNILGYDAEALEAIRQQLCGESKFNELWKSLHQIDNGLTKLEGFIGCTDVFKAVFNRA